MENEYYIQKNGEHTGPFSLHELIQMDLRVDTLILSPEYDGWQKAADLPELFEYFEANGVYFPTDDNLASFWWRFMAYIVDSLLLSYPLSFIRPPGVKEAYDRMLTSTTTTADMLLLLKFNLISFVILAIYHAVCEASALQGSLGKKLFKLIVVNADGQRLSIGRAFLRNIGKFISGSVLLIGYLAVLWDSHKQAWHDQWAKTYIIIRNR
ncbi:RDD family protein [Inquilinus sp. KBS0705]|nr:RDD family protein [Inquilinus sp. KBS0705]